MWRPLSRLRWQLTLSHLVAIAFTLVSMIAALLLIVSAWWGRTTDPSLQPAADARVVADSVHDLVVRDIGEPGSDMASAEMSDGRPEPARARQ